MECSIARAVDAVCDPWSLLVLRHAFLGARRFGDLQSALDIPPTTLARRLDELTRKGLVSRRRYDERPPRDEYHLTPKGLDVLPVLISLAVWGSRWLAPSGPPLELVDFATGRKLDPVLVDRETGEVLEPGGVALALGRGASPRLQGLVRATGKVRLPLGARAEGSPS